MNALQMILLSMFLTVFTGACKARSNESPSTASVGTGNSKPINPPKGADDEGEDASDGDSTDTDEPSDGDTPDEEGGSLQKKLDDLAAQLKETELQKKTAEEELQKLKAAGQVKVVPKAGEKGPSGNNYCPTAGYYGDITLCGAYFCAKADPNMLATCEAHAGSKRAPGISGNPACPDYYHGDIFTCGTLLCAKSDPELLVMCELPFAAPVP